MGDLIYVISVVVIGVVVIAFIIIMAKKRLDAISAETSSVYMDMQTDEVSGETPTGIEIEGDPADLLLDSPYYDKYESLFNYIWTSCHGKDEPQYKFDWLLQSLDMGRKLETGFYVMESIQKDLPYFCETEPEYEMFFKSQAPVLCGSVQGILDMISFYLYLEKHPAKQEYWQQCLLGLAQSDNYEAQAALCTNHVRHAFSEQELVAFKETYEEDLMRLAETGNREAQLAVGEFLMKKPPQKIAWLTKAAQQGSSDAWFQLGLTYESMINIDDDGQFKPNRLADEEIHQLMVKKAECFLNGANANNGIMAAWCQYKVGDYYAEGDLLPKDLQKAIYWLRQAIENGEDAQGTLDYVLRQCGESQIYDTGEIQMNMIDFFRRNKKNELRKPQVTQKIIQPEHNNYEAKIEIREDMERGYTLRQCSKIIDAYNYMNENEVFDMMGNIYVVVPEPQVRTLMGHKDAPDKPVEVIFDAYYDNWHLRGLLEGQGSLSSDFHGSKVYRRIPQYLADNYRVPQILVDETVTVTLEEQKIKWSVSIDPAVQLYGLYDVVGFRERFEIFSDLLKSRYPNLKNLIITFRH